MGANRIVVEARPSEMEERVARALCRQACLGDPGTLFIDFNWPGYVDAARSAIEAMLEPTDKMVDAGLAAFRSHDPRVCDPRDTVEQIIREAIDAALSSTGGSR